MLARDMSLLLKRKAVQRSPAAFVCPMQLARSDTRTSTDRISKPGGQYLPHPPHAAFSISENLLTTAGNASDLTALVAWAFHESEPAISRAAPTAKATPNFRIVPPICHRLKPWR